MIMCFSKRSVILNEPEDWGQWLTCTPVQATNLLRTPANDVFIGEPTAA